MRVKKLFIIGGMKLIAMCAKKSPGECATQDWYFDNYSNILIIFDNFVIINIMLISKKMTLRTVWCRR